MQEISTNKYKSICGRGSDIIFHVPQCHWPIEMSVDGDGQGLVVELGVASLVGADKKITMCRRCVGNPGRKCDLSAEITDLNPQ